MLSPKKIAVALRAMLCDSDARTWWRSVKLITGQTVNRTQSLTGWLIKSTTATLAPWQVPSIASSRAWLLTAHWTTVVYRRHLSSPRTSSPSSWRTWRASWVVWKYTRHRDLTDCLTGCYATSPVILQAQCAPSTMRQCAKDLCRCRGRRRMLCRCQKYTA